MCKDEENVMKSGIVTFVGAGPGDPSLLTVEAKDAIQQADVILYDALTSATILNAAKSDCKLIDVGKRASHHVMRQEEIHALLVQYAKQGAHVVRLQGGDCFVFGRGGEEAEVLAEAGIPFTVIPGVSSCIAAPETAGISITHRAYASAFHVITGHKAKNAQQALDYAALAKLEGTLIFLMSLQNLPEIVHGLCQGGMSPQMPAAVVQQGATPMQRVVYAPLSALPQAVLDAHLHTPALTIVGEAASDVHRYPVPSPGPLAGKKILLTGTVSYVEGLGAALKAQGGNPVEISCIETVRLPEIDVTQIDWAKYTWLVWTSANGVNLFFHALMEAHVDFRAIAHLHFAVMGEGTARALSRYGFTPDCMPEQFESAALADALCACLTPADHVLLLRAENASRVLPGMLKSHGFMYTELPFYHTLPQWNHAEILCREVKDSDYVVFASASAVRAFVQMAPASVRDEACRYIAIGPATARAISKAGLCVHGVAENATHAGIAACILQDMSRTTE